jgi:hypothetical protein
LVVLAREEELGPLPLEVGGQGGEGIVELDGELGVVRLLDELEGREEVPDARLEAAPEVDLLAEAVRLAQGALCGSLVVPEAGLLGQRLELGDPPFLVVEVKDAPRSRGSAGPGPGSRQRPSSSLVPCLEVLEEDRSELDEPQGGLAPGDDGVHARTIAVMGADAAVPVTVECGCVTARSAVPLTRDEIYERRFLGLLHKSLFSLGCGDGAMERVGAFGRSPGILRAYGFRGVYGSGFGHSRVRRPVPATFSG